ncbi:protein DBF4 homolog B [Sceloporus undulatus]|uniref:protein DBF4 homolog B n=1 Tax=Sceloporus undulatus TaxID=8520 RepID=UPI001C4BCBD6|nr:protein DBF4 homolog B [Sceloporus undulatus]
MSSARSFPLVGKSFYLDIPSGKNLDFLTENVKRLGGVIESFLSKEVTYVVSNSQEARQDKWAGKHTRNVLRDTHTGALPSAGPQRDHRSPLPKPVDMALISRGKKLLHKAIGSQDNIPGNSILVSARLWGVQIIHTDEMLTYIQRLSRKHLSKAKMKLCASGYQPRKVARLTPHFLKIEDKSRRLRPFFKHFKNFPQLYFSTQKRQSPFEPPHTSSISKKHKSQDSANEASPLSDGCFVPQLQKGYCECCERPFTELRMHLHSPQHMEFVSDPSHYTHLDSIISQLTNDFVCSFTPLLRVPSATGNGEPLELLMEMNEKAAVPPSDGALQCCLFAEGSEGQFLNLGGSSHLFEVQDFLQLTATPLEVFSTSAPFALQSPETASELREEGRVVANSDSQASTPVEVKHHTASQQERVLAQPTASRKRKHSCSAFGPVKKKQALTSDKKHSSTDLVTGEQQVGIVQCPSPNLNDNQGAPKHPGFCAHQLHAPSHLCAPPHLPVESCSCHLSEPVAINTKSLKSPVQQLDQEEESALRNGTCAVSFPCNISKSNIGLRSTPDLSLGKHKVPKLLGSVVQHSSPEITEIAQTRLPQQPGLGPSPCLCLSSKRMTCISTDEKSSSSISEWDGPLLCSLAGASHLPSEGLIDAALLGTCVSMQDSNYESHLCSVLWRTPQENWSCNGNNTDYQNNCTEMTKRSLYYSEHLPKQLDELSCSSKHPVVCLPPSLPSQPYRAPLPSL